MSRIILIAALLASLNALADDMPAPEAPERYHEIELSNPNHDKILLDTRTGAVWVPASEHPSREPSSEAQEAPAPVPQVAPTAPAPMPAPMSAPDEFMRESYVSGLLGAAIGTSSGSSNSLIFGGRLGTGIFGSDDGQFAVGLVVAHDSESTQVGTVAANGSATLLMAELLARKVYGTGLYFGVRIGLDLVSVTVSSGEVSYSASATPFVIGPALGYEFPVAPDLAINFDFSWLNVNGATFTFPTLGAIQTQSAGGATLMGGLTYHW